VKSALVLSLAVALMLTVSGATYEVASDSSGTITACVHHKGGGLYVASKCAPHDRRISLIAGGSQNVSGGPAANLFAQIAVTGEINASSPGVSASELSGHTGTYRVDFGENIARCAASATLGSVPIFGIPGANTPRAVGFAVVDMFAPGYTFSNGYPSADTVQVETIVGGVRVDAPFYIIVVC
jgi:hypothetical protein